MFPEVSPDLRSKRRCAQPYPVLGTYRDIIERWVREDRENARKQRHTARTIFMRLVKLEEYTGSEVTACRYVR